MGRRLKVTYKHANVACINFIAFLLGFNKPIVGELNSIISVYNTRLFYLCRFVMLGHQSLEFIAKLWV